MADPIISQFIRVSMKCLWERCCFSLKVAEWSKGRTNPLTSQWIRVRVECLPESVAFY